MSRTKTLIVSVGLVVVLTGGIVGFAWWGAARDSQRRKAEAEPVGLVATPSTWEEPDKDGDTRTVEGFTLTYGYSAQGKPYAQTVEQVTWYSAEKHYKVCYNPADPKDADLYTADHRCGS